MNTRHTPSPVVSILLTLVLLAAIPPLARAQITNWIAFNDHRPSTTPAANGWAITGPGVSGYDMGVIAETTGPLTNYLTGDELVATVTFTPMGAGVPDDFGAVGRPIMTNTPMGHLFYGICDLSNDGIVGVRGNPPNASDSFVSITFSVLDPSKRYVFRGAGVRNGGYGTRWSVAAISAASWTDAHVNGAGGPGVLTAVTYPAGGFAAGEAAWNSGANNEGALVGWNDIEPFIDGTFSITVRQYTNSIPGGVANGPYGYAFAGIMLAEVETVAPTITQNPPASTSVEQNRKLSLNVQATGAPLFYQWYRQSTGEIPGATLSTYSVAQAALTDSDMYYVVVYNSLGRQTSTVAQVTVFADTTAPSVDAIFSYPTVDPGGFFATLDQIIIEFNEAVTPGSVSSPASYTVPGGGNPVSVIVTNERSVVLVLGTPLAEDTDYSVTLSGATDLEGNMAGSSMASFHSWAAGSGNGLLMESYIVEDPSLLPESVLDDPDYPDNPSRADSMGIFDTRVVYPTDDEQGYGARIRGVFIPPVSGDWRFFARMPVLGVLYLNPNGIAEDGKIEVLRQSTQNAPYNWDRLQSSLIPLRAGQAYYIEGLYKAVSGANYFKVAARLAEDGVPMPVDTPDTEVDANALTGAIIAYPLAPRDLGGPLTIVRDLEDLTVEENNPILWTFEVSNPSGAALHYVWLRDGAQVSTAPNYNFRPNVLDDDGAMFQVQVAKIGSDTVSSRTMRLTVVPDVTPPQVLKVRTDASNLSNIVVYFNEPVTQIDAEDFFNYQTPGLTLNQNVSPNPSLAGDDRTVTLQFDPPMTLNASYEITIQNITDLTMNPMDPVTITFVAGVNEGAMPDLTITVAGGQATISWPAPSTGFILESADAIVTPVSSIVWAPVPGTPTVIDGRNTLTVDATSSFKIFRLRQ